MIRLLHLDRQHASIREELDEAIARVIESSEFLGGLRENPFVRGFEQEFAEYVGVKHCVGVGSGTDAIRIALGGYSKLSGIGDVLVPANTAYPVAEAVIDIAWNYAVYLVDCDPVTYTALPDGEGEKTFISCHQYGHPCDMDAVLAVAGERDLLIIEDCSHAHGAKYKGRNVGTFGDAAVFSFNPTKILGAMGDAGCIVTDDDDLAQMCRQLADHGRKEKYTHDYIGWNSRLDGLQAAVLSVKLKYLDKWVERRRDIASLYVYSLIEYDNDDKVRLPMHTFVVPDTYYHAWHQFVIRVKNRDQVKAKLFERGIQTNIHYPLSLPEQPALQYLGYNPDDFVATQLSREILSLPINESMTDEEVETVCKTLKEILHDCT